MQLEFLTRGELWRLYYSCLDAIPSEGCEDSQLDFMREIEAELTERYGVKFAPF